MDIFEENAQQIIKNKTLNLDNTCCTCSYNLNKLLDKALQPKKFRILAFFHFLFNFALCISTKTLSSSGVIWKKRDIFQMNSKKALMPEKQRKTEQITIFC